MTDMRIGGILLDNETFTVGYNVTRTAVTSETDVTPLCIMFATGVVGNLLAMVVLLFSRKRHRRNNTFYKMVACMAVTDLLGSATTSPIVMVAYKRGRKFPGGDGWLCRYFGFMLTWAGVATTLIACVMAIERFVAVKYPIWHNTRFTRMYARYSMLFIWLLSAAISALPLTGVGRYAVQFPGSWCFFNFVSVDHMDQLFAYMYTIFIIVVLIITVFCNACVIVILLRLQPSGSYSPSPTSGSLSRTNSVSFGSGTHHVTPSMRTRHAQMVVLLVGIVLLLLVCWLPMMVRILINQTKLYKPNRWADLLALRVASWNPILNPWIYILCRKEVLNYLRMRSCRNSVRRRGDGVSMDRRWTGRHGPPAFLQHKHTSKAGCLCDCENKRAGRHQSLSRAGSQDSTTVSNTGSSFISRATSTSGAQSSVRRKSSSSSCEQYTSTTLEFTLRSAAKRTSSIGKHSLVKEEQVRLSILHEASEPESTSHAQSHSQSHSRESN